MKLKTLTIAFALFFGVGAANAEDNYYYQGQGSAGNAYGYDNTYQLPPSYQGQYYPRENQGAIGYHGTNRTSQNDTAQEDYYNYYY